MKVNEALLLLQKLQAQGYGDVVMRTYSSLDKELYPPIAIALHEADYNLLYGQVWIEVCTKNEGNEDVVRLVE